MRSRPAAASDFRRALAEARTVRERAVHSLDADTFAHARLGRSGFEGHSHLAASRMLRLQLLCHLCPHTRRSNGEVADDRSPVGPVDPDLPWPALLLALTGQDVLLCPRCEQRTIVRQLLPPARAPPEVRGDA